MRCVLGSNSGKHPKTFLAAPLSLTGRYPRTQTPVSLAEVSPNTVHLPNPKPSGIATTEGRHSIGTASPEIPPGARTPSRATLRTSQSLVRKMVGREGFEPPKSETPDLQSGAARRRCRLPSAAPGSTAWHHPPILARRSHHSPYRGIGCALIPSTPFEVEMRALVCRVSI